jgi:hypothetical protein
MGTTCKGAHESAPRFFCGLIVKLSLSASISGKKLLVSWCLGGEKEWTKSPNKVLDSADIKL